MWGCKDIRYPEVISIGSLDAVVTPSQSSSQGYAQIHFPTVKKKEHRPQLWKAYEPQKSLNLLWVSSIPT